MERTVRKPPYTDGMERHRALVQLAEDTGSDVTQLLAKGRLADGYALRRAIACLVGQGWSLREMGTLLGRSHVTIFHMKESIK